MRDMKIYIGNIIYRISSNSYQTRAATKRGRLLLSSVKGKIIEWVIVVK